MRILGLDVTRHQKNIPGKLDERSIPLEQYLSNYGIPFNTNSSTVTSVTALNLSSVFKALTLISDSISSLPLEPYTLQGNTWKVDYNQPSYNMLNVEPHPMFGKFNFWKVMTVNIFLHGDAYAYIVRDGAGNPLQMIPLDPTKVEVYINEADLKLKYKIIDMDGFIEKDDMIHVLNYTTNGYTGTSTIHYGATSLGIASGADKSAYGFFQSGLNSSGILSVDRRLTKDQADAIKSSWNQAFSPFTDGSNPGGVAIMENGVEYKPITLDPQTAQLLSTREFSVEEVARWFNLPGSKLGMTEGRYYNSRNDNNLEYLQTTLTPIIEKIENELERKLYRPSERNKVRAKFDEDSMFRLDTQSRVEYLTKLKDAGFISTNEGREKLGYEPVEDGDVITIKSGYMPLGDFDSEATTGTVEQGAPAQNKLPKSDVEHGAPKRQRSRNKKEN